MCDWFQQNPEKDTGSSVCMKRKSITILGRAVAAVLCATTVLCSASFSTADNWNHWRGPNFDGSSEETGLPGTISKDKNTIWSEPMPGPSFATPAIWGKKVFVVSADEDKTSMFAMCLDSETGETLWYKKLIDETDVPRRNTRATCSPVTDGSRVIFMFGTSDLFAFDMDGRRLWSRNLDNDGISIETKFGYSSSPLLVDGKLYIEVLRRKSISPGPRSTGTDEDSYLVRINLETGKTMWKVHRPSDRDDETLDAYSSPVPWKSGNTTMIVVAGADHVTGHDDETGRELWRCNYNPEDVIKWRLVSSVTVADGMVFGMQPRHGLVYAFPLGRKTDMTLDDAVWTYEGETTDVTTPLYYRGRLYIMADKSGVLTCLDPKTGKRIWEGELGDNALFYASPTGADGKIFCINQDGHMVTVAAGDEFKVLSRCELGGNPCNASVAVADGKLFVRTADSLHCLAE